jgi:tight adherence protein C
MMATLLVFMALALLSISMFQTKSALSRRLRPRATIQSSVRQPRKFGEVDVLMELPDFASLVSFAVAAGESLDTALRIAVQRSSGLLSHEFGSVIRSVDHGSILQLELERLGGESVSPQVQELAIKLALASSNGSAISILLSEYTQSAIQEMKATLLERAGRNETKMMIPLVFVILPITVMFAVYPSLTILQKSFL